MAHLGETFDTETMELSSFDIIPPQRVIAQIIGEEDKTTRGGKMLVLTFEILDGEFEGRRFWTNYNYVNESEKAQKIALEQFAHIAKALGIRLYDDTIAFHGLPMFVDVTIEKGSGTYPDRNVAKNGGYHPLTAGDTTQIPQQGEPSNNNAAPGPGTTNRQADAAPQRSAPPPRAAASGGRPWDRKN